MLLRRKVSVWSAAAMVLAATLTPTWLAFATSAAAAANDAARFPSLESICCPDLFVLRPYFVDHYYS